MPDEIRVSVNRYGDRRNLVLRWTDPITGERKAKTAGTPDRRLAERRIPANLDFRALRHLRLEAREKLARIRPVDLAQASRISGITPADLAVLMIHLEGIHKEMME